MQKNIEIKANKKNCYSNIILFIIVIIVTAFLFFYKDTRRMFHLTSYHITYYWLLQGFLLLLILFSCYVIYFYYRLVKHEVILFQVDEKGILDHSSSIAVGFIPWHDIHKIYICKFLGQSMIEIELQDEESYINKLSKWKRLLISINKWLHHQAICISLEAYKVSTPETFDEMKVYIPKHIITEKKMPY